MWSGEFSGDELDLNLEEQLRLTQAVMKRKLSLGHRGTARTKHGRADPGQRVLEYLAGNLDIILVTKASQIELKRLHGCALGTETVTSIKPWGSEITKRHRRLCQP